jgi:hypothetical protein
MLAPATKSMPSDDHKRTSPPHGSRSVSIHFGFERERGAATDSGITDGGGWRCGERRGLDFGGIDLRSGVSVGSETLTEHGAVVGQGSCECWARVS